MPRLSAGPAFTVLPAIANLSEPSAGLSLSSLLFPLSSLIWAVGPIRPSLVRGLRPRNAPSPTTCLVDRVLIFVTGAHSSEFLRPRSLQSHQIPVGAGLVPAHAHPKFGAHPRIFQRQQCIQSERGPVEFKRVIGKDLTGFTKCRAGQLHLNWVAKQGNCIKISDIISLCQEVNRHYRERTVIKPRLSLAGNLKARENPSRTGNCPVPNKVSEETCAKSSAKVRKRNTVRSDPT